MLMKLFQLLYAGGRPSQDQAPSCNESQEELFTETDISRMSKDEILRSLGIRSKNTLSQLRITMLKFSITCFVKKLTDDEVKAVVVNLKLSRHSQEKGRCRGALVRHYIGNKNQQDHIRAMLLARGEQVTGSADVGKHATQTTNEKRGAGESKLPRTNATVDSNLSDNATGASGSDGDAFRQQPSKRQTTGARQMKAPKGAASQQTSSSGNESQELFTVASISEWSRADIMNFLGIKTKNTLKQLRVNLVKSSITSFVEKMPVEKVTTIVVHLKLPRYSQEKARCKGALVRHFMENEDQQAEIRTMLLASKDQAAGSAGKTAAEAMEVDSEVDVDENRCAGGRKPPESDATVADTDLPEIASFSNDFYPDEKLSRKMQENFDQLRDYRRERIERINAGNSSWSSHA